MVLVGSDQLRCEIVAPVFALLGDELPAVTPVAHHVRSDTGLFCPGGIAPREALALCAPDLQLIVVGLRESDEAEDGLARKREAERLDEFSRRTGLHHGVDQLVAAAADVRLEGLDPPVAEPLACEVADAAVVGLGTVRHHRDRVVVRHRQHVLRLGAQWEDRVLHIDRGEGFVVSEDAIDLVHLGDDEIVELL